MDQASQALNPSELRDRMRERLRQIDAEMSALQRERENLTNDLDITEHFLAVWRRANNLPGPELPRERAGIVGNARVLAVVDKRRNPPRERVVEGALALIKDAGRPLSRAELFDGLKSMGLEVFGKDPQMVLSTMLWRSQDQVVRIKDHGYWPKGAAYKAGGYHPALNDFFPMTEGEPEGGIEDLDEDGEG